MVSTPVVDSGSLYARLSHGHLGLARRNLDSVAYVLMVTYWAYAAWRPVIPSAHPHRWPGAWKAG